VLRIAVYFAGYSWSEADALRKRASQAEEEGELELERQRFIEGAIRTTHATRKEAEAVFAMIAAFKGYGFAESHAWAFAQHAYTSAYLRHHYPAEYFAAVLTEQPGMWPKESIRQELRRWGVPVLPLDINISGLTYRCDRQGSRKSIRPSRTAVEGVSATVAKEILLARLEAGPFHSLDDFYGRVKLDKDQLLNLVRAGAFDSLHTRREGLCRANALVHSLPAGARPLFTAVPKAPKLKPLTVAETFAHHQGDQFAALASPDNTNEEAYLLQQFTRAVMGSNNIDRRLSPNQVAVERSVRAALGTDVANTNNMQELFTDVQSALVVGPDLGKTEPIASYWFYHARLYREAKMVVISQDHYPLCDRGDLWLKPNPGTTATLLNGIAHQIVELGLASKDVSEEAGFAEWRSGLSRFDVDLVERETGVSAEHIKIAALLYATAGFTADTPRPV
jgi:hypothetical protein